MSVAPVPIVGVSLGHRHQKTAISVTERAYIPTGETFNALDYDHRYKRTRLMAHEKVIVEYHVRHLERHGPPSRYASVAQRMPEVVHKIGQEFILVVDMTATGRPAYSLILAELTSTLEGTRFRFKHCPLTVSGVAGGVSRSPDVGFLVPRRDLISVSQILFDKGQLKIAEALPLARTLTDELLAFKPKAETPGDELEGWREGKDDDLVLAVAISVWAPERFLRRKDSVPFGALSAS